MRLLPIWKDIARWLKDSECMHIDSNPNPSPANNGLLLLHRQLLHQKIHWHGFERRWVSIFVPSVRGLCRGQWFWFVPFYFRVSWDNLGVHKADLGWGAYWRHRWWWRRRGPCRRWVCGIQEDAKNEERNAAFSYPYG